MPATRLLDRIQIASHCTASWESMEGDERSRFCNQCRLHVYNLSAMSEREATEMVEQTEGRLCARFYRRADGTVATRDCPVGVAAMRRRLVRAWGAAVAVTSFLLANVAGAIGAYHLLEYVPGGKILMRDPFGDPSLAGNAARRLLGRPPQQQTFAFGAVCIPTTTNVSGPFGRGPDLEIIEEAELLDLDAPAQ